MKQKLVQINFWKKSMSEDEVNKEHLIERLNNLKKDGYTVLMDLTGVDYLAPFKYTKIIYFLHNPENYKRTQIYLLAKREEAIPSVTSIWESADWYERELFDMFGIHFEGHPALKRILMPDDWKGHPMLRDYALTEVSVLFKHDVKPKVPSEIIPYVRNKDK